MSVQIRLSGEAAAQAQHLVAEFAREDVAIEPLSRSDADRDLQELVNDVVVGLTVEAAYELVREVIDRWIKRSNLSQGDVDVVAPDED